MQIRQLMTVGLTVLVVVGFSVALAQRPLEQPAAAALDPDTVAVRLVLGVGDEVSLDWSGRATLDKGEIESVEGVRFRDGDRVTGRGAWKAQTRVIRKTAVAKKAAAVAKALARAKRQQAAPKAVGGPTTYGAQFAPNAVVLALKNVGGATLTVETAQGRFAIPLDRIGDGRPVPYLDGRVRAQRVFAHAPLSEGPLNEDFPAAVRDPGGNGAWITAVWHEPRGPELQPALDEQPKNFADFMPKGGGDQVRLVHFSQSAGKDTTESPIDVTEPGQDVWRPAVAAAGDGSVFTVWTEKRGDNWDLFGRRYDPKTKTLSAVERLTDQPGTDTDAVLATAGDGRVWVAWQAWTGGQADIFLAPLDASGKLGTPPTKVSDTPANEWAPSIAADGSGRIHIAFDSYQNENYDVMLRTRQPDGTLGPAVAVAGTAAFEARPSIAADMRGRVWVAYEERTPSWGKDAVNLLDGRGSTLYRSSKVSVRVIDGARVLQTPDPVGQAPPPLQEMNSYPRILLDHADRPWLVFRHRQEAIWGNNAAFVVGGVWVEHATSLSGPSWSPPRPLTRSDGLLDNRPALVEPGRGPVLAFYSTDGRLRREVEMRPELTRRYFTNQGTPPGVFNVDLEVSALYSPVPFEEPRLTEADPESRAPVALVHPQETADLERMRAYRVQAAGKTYRLLRGEFHRHCEISADGGADGSLEDMWRYALDAARLDWLGNGDHDNGGGKEYTWWLVQKTTDLYTAPPVFVPMFTYERSVTYPHGHRNVMFDHRGVRPLPRLVGPSGVIDQDTMMLYAYLKEHNGICASHTSATGMGTDWRDVDPTYEPFVEIFQGHRQSYEHLGAPRAARRAGESIGGWQPLGMVWNALAMQYRMGFEASSDHISTHISYAVALAEDTTRAAILGAFRHRHCYAATDNIIMDVRSGDHLMGDEFDADGPVKLKVYVQGTAPVARVDVIKDFKYVYSTEPGKEQVEFQWTDDERGRPAGLSWYYVRAVQADGQLAWASPIWVHTP
jgi:hypothetical protein